MKEQTFRYEIIPQTSLTTNYLRVELTFEKLLKIKEINLYKLVESKESSFIYFYVDNNCNSTHNFYFGEYGKNNVKYGARTLPVEFETTILTKQNELYNQDFDFDSIENSRDNCINIANSDQKDINYNSIGDACEDDDRDSIINSLDNCPQTSNRNQIDSDLDSIGDACDKEDSRYLEQNPIVIYILAGFIALIFIGVSFLLVKKK